MRARFFISIVVLSTLATAAWAGEHVTLRNGYEMHCDHRADVEGHVRLFLSAGEDNFIEFAPEEIATVEHVADPPPEIAEGPAKKAAMVRPEPANDAKLSPADLHEILAKAGGDHNLDADLLASLVKAESGGNARAVSRAGARGLMQLMPRTAHELGVGDSFKPDENVRGGTTYLDALLVYYHDNLALALAAYNAGPVAVDKYHGIPPYRETRTYVAYVIHEFNRRVLARQALARQTIASSATSQDKGTR
jgi:soluble lytic murein transglycosylase-like protein